MHKKYSREGLVIMMVDVDPAVVRDPMLPQIVEKVRDKLQKHDLAPMVNLILDEPQELIDEKLKVGTPGSFVFSRDGKWRRLADEGEGYDEAVEKLVVKLLAAK
jgi:hypothetical protein